MKFLNNLNNLIWSLPLIITIIFFAFYITIRCDFFQIKKIKLILKSTLFSSIKKSKSGSFNARQSMFCSLGATIGVGNIIGISGAVIIGGSGTVFWIWISYILCSMIKFCENVLGIYYRKKCDDGSYIGGPMQYIYRGLNNKFFAVIYAISCIFCSFGIGNLCQTNSVCHIFKSSFNIPYFIPIIIISVIFIFAVFKSFYLIGKISDFLVPFMLIIYFGGCLFILFKNIERLPFIFYDIFKNAFSLKKCATGGIIAFVAIRCGISRSIFASEAGLGSSVIAHSNSNEQNPVKQGMWGIFEVFASMIVSTLTALVVLITKSNKNALFSFSDNLGKLGDVFICVIIFCFALSSIIGWCFYGSKCVSFINEKYLSIYKIAFLLFIPIGAYLKNGKVFIISDILNGITLIINLTSLILLSNKFIRIKDKFI